MNAERFSAITGRYSRLRVGVVGDFFLDRYMEIDPARGETSIEVTFTLDVSGILQVRARDAQTGTEQRASVDLLGAMPDEDVEGARERLQALKR